MIIFISSTGFSDVRGSVILSVYISVGINNDLSTLLLASVSCRPTAGRT